MWSPTHVHVIVHRAENLVIKGKNGSNNAFVVIELGKDTYRTSVKEKCGKSVVWSEECELKIPKSGNTSCIVFTAYHRNSIGLDQFLGRVKIPLISFDKCQRTTELYNLNGKPGKEKGREKARGKLEVEIGFISKLQSQSLISLQTKGKLSFEKLTGSLFGLRQSDKKVEVKKFARKSFLNKKKKDLIINDNLQNNVKLTSNNHTSPRNCNNLDPGVISDDEEEASHQNLDSQASLLEDKNNITIVTTPPNKPRRMYLKNPQISVSHWEDDSKSKLMSYLNISQGSVNSAGNKKQSTRLEDLQRRLADRRLSTSCVDFSLLISPKPEKKFSSSLNLEKHHGDSQTKLSKLARKIKNLHYAEKKELRRTVIGCETDEQLNEEKTVPKSEYKNKNKDELINMVVDLQKKVNCVSVRVKDLEDYLDNILLKVMETVPKILEKS